MIRRFARPYATAILDVAGSPAKAGEVRLELDRFAAVMKTGADLAVMYANPGVDLDSKLKITSTIAGKLGLSDLAVKVLEVLIRNHRINDLPAIAEAVATLVNERLNVVVAEVKTAHNLNETEKAELRKTLETRVGKKVELKLATDPSLLGGFVAKLGSEIWDASVVGKIHKFRASLA
jgi:F-type H+-transporting ATPase subunit delta